MSFSHCLFWGLGGIAGSHSAPWYQYVFLGLAIFIVCPVWCLSEIGRFRVTWKNLIWLEGIVLSTMIVSTVLLRRVYPTLNWRHPMFAILLVAFGRVVIWGLYQLFKGEVGDD